MADKMRELTRCPSCGCSPVRHANRHSKGVCYSVTCGSWNSDDEICDFISPRPSTTKQTADYAWEESVMNYEAGYCAALPDGCVAVSRELLDNLADCAAESAHKQSMYETTVDWDLYKQAKAILEGMNNE